MLLDPIHHETAAQLGLPLGGTFATFALAIPSGGARAHARVLPRVCAQSVRWRSPRATGSSGSGFRAVSWRRRSSPVRLRSSILMWRADELAASLADVRLAMDVLLRQGRTGVVPLQDLSLDLLLARAPRVAARLRARVLDPLGPRHGRSRGDLHRTVAAYVALHRDRQQTAAQLHIHPNTLDHRLRRARELSGLNLEDPEDLATMVLALHGGG